MPLGQNGENMIEFKCTCGNTLSLDETTEDRVKCQYCNKISNLQKALNPEQYEILLSARENTKGYYDKIIKDYESGNSEPLKNAIHRVISKTDLKGYYVDYWFDCIFATVGIAIKKGDSGTVEILKAHARNFDNKHSSHNSGDRRLYNDLVFLYPEILNDAEWKIELVRAKSDPTELLRLQESALKRVKENKNSALIISIVNVLAASPEEFKDFGNNFLNTILEDKTITNDILTVEFFSKAKGSFFARKLKKYVTETYKDKEVILKDTPVWNNAEEAKHKKKKKIIIIASSVSFAIIAVIGSLLIFLNSTNKKTIELEGSGIVNIVYSKTPDLSAYTIAYEKYNGTRVTVPVSAEMLSGYDGEKLGVQNATITYKDMTFEVTVDIKAFELETPQAYVSGNLLTWERIEHADEYYIYFSENANAVDSALGAKVEDIFFDLSTVNIGSTFYAKVSSVSKSYKYADSQRSDIVTVKKLHAPDAIVYDKENSKFTWNTVEGAEYYAVTVNGNTISNIQTTEYSYSMESGTTEISVSAFPSEENVIKSVSETKSFYKLSPVSGFTYADNIITWVAESEAVLFNIYRDGQLIKENHSGKAFDASSWEKGVHTVKIEAVADTLTKIDSESYERKIHIGEKLVCASGKLTWSSLGGTSFDVYVDGEKVASDLISAEREISSFGLSVGEHKIYVVVKDNDSISETVTLKRLATPTLLLSNQILTVSENTAGFELKVNGIVYNGEYNDIIAGLTNVGNHTITAVNKAESSSEIDSDTVTLTLTKLSAPSISVVDGALYSGSVTSLSWFVDGAPIESIALLTAGEHTVYAKTKATEADQIDSESSNVLTVTKLPTPTLTYASTPTKNIICNFPGHNAEDYSGKGNIVYYRKTEAGEEPFDIGNLNNLSGLNEITAVYKSITDNVLSSEISNMVSVVATNIKLKVVTSGNRLTAILEEGEVGLSYEIDVKWFDTSGQFDELSYPKTEFTSTRAEKAISIVRSGKTATRIEIVVRIIATDGSTTDTLSYVWTK